MGALTALIGGSVLLVTLHFLGLVRYIELTFKAIILTLRWVHSLRQSRLGTLLYWLCCTMPPVSPTETHCRCSGIKQDGDQCTRGGHIPEYKIYFCHDHHTVQRAWHESHFWVV